MPIPLGVLAVAGAGGGGSVLAGYFGGGRDTSGNVSAVVNKFAFADDTRTTVGTDLNPGIAYMAAMANSGTAGYFGHGISQADARQTAVQKYTFPDDSRSTISATLTTGLIASAGMANSGTAGYIGGGQNGLASFADVDKIAFPNDTKSTLASGVDPARWGIAAMANSGTAGYFGGGVTGADHTEVNKFAFSNDSRTTLGTGLSIARRDLAGMANSGTAGYFAGGNLTGTATMYTTVDKFAFSNDARSTLATGLSSARGTLGAMAQSGTAGYVGGGYTSLGGANGQTTVDKFTFSSDSRSTLGTGLSAGRSEISGMANSGTI